MTFSDAVNITVVVVVLVGFVWSVWHSITVNALLRNSGLSRGNDHDLGMLQAMNQHIKSLEHLVAERDAQIAAYEKLISRQLEDGGALAAIPNEVSPIRTKLLVYFSEKEVRELCDTLQIPYEGVAGGSVQEKIVNIVDYLNRYDEIGALAQWLRRAYPHIEW